MPTDDKKSFNYKIFLSEVLSRFVNLVMIATVFLLVTNDLAEIAIPVFLLSKWRVFSTRQISAIPSNILKSSCDIIFGLSIISLMNHYWLLSQQEVVYGLTSIFLLWQLVLKPMSVQWAVATQSLIALFFGLTAIWIDFGADSIGIIAILLTGLVGYITAFHSLRQFEETTDNSVLLSMTWTMITVEYAWLTWLWNIHYGPIWFSIRVPQIALVLALVGYFLYSLILVREDKNERARQIFIQQSLFVTTLMAFILFFTDWSATL